MIEPAVTIIQDQTGVTVILHHFLENNKAMDITDVQSLSGLTVDQMRINARSNKKTTIASTAATLSPSGR
jgi:hypothetical protein